MNIQNNPFARYIIHNAPELLAIVAAISLVVQLVLAFISAAAVIRQSGGLMFLQTFAILGSVLYQPAVILGVAAIAAFLRDGHLGSRR